MYFDNIEKEIKSIKKQIENQQEILRLIDEKISAYQDSEIPIRYERDREKCIKEISALQHRLELIVETRVDLGKFSNPLDRLIHECPYELNREEQESILTALISELNKKPIKPLLCIIHGDKSQCHDTFSRRLINIFLPEIIGIKNDEKTCIKPYYPSFPIAIKDIKDFPHRFRENLAKKVFEDDRNASEQKINHYLAKYPGPVVFDVHLLADDLQKSSFKAIIISFINFWNKWPYLADNQRLFVFLCIEYKIKQYHGICQIFNFKSRESDISMIIEEICPSQLNNSIGIIGRVLPKLEGITEAEVRQWASDMQRKHFPTDIEFLEYMRQEIEVIFNQYESKYSPKKIPMSDLAMKLKRILYDYINPI